MSDPSEKERLFFALWPSEQQQQAWARMAKEWLPRDGSRLVPSQNLHLTLLFIGEVDQDQRRCLEQVADAVGGDPFVLHFDISGYWRRPQVAWWGCSQTPEPLLNLVQALQRGATGCGLKVDQRPYAAHLTLARKVRKAPVPMTPEVGEWGLDRFALLRSQLTPGGALYEPLRYWSLIGSST